MAKYIKRRKVMRIGCIRVGLQAFALTFVFCCYASAQNPPSSPDASSSAAPINFDFRKSSALTDAEAHALEDSIKANPEDAASRAILLGYYFIHQSSQRGDVDARRDQILWMVGNRPADHFSGTPFCQIVPTTDPEGYAAARTLWRQQTEKFSQSAAVLANAAECLSLQDAGAATELYKRAEMVDPNNPDWPQDLAYLYWRQEPATNPSDQLERRRKALAEFERCYALSTAPDDRFYSLTPLPNAAVDSGDNAKATAYAKQLLLQAESCKDDWNYGNAIHEANLALGRVALASGDTATAKARLLDAGATPGSPQLDSYGPNMELARELLQKGEKDVVLEYFDLCAKFWTKGGVRLDSWRQKINAGGMPDFGANLH
jgi:hypothetical protein